MIKHFFCTLASIAVSATSVSAGIAFDWAVVGNPGNTADNQTGRGSVAYTYRISKHEVTNAQFAEFLNAVDPTASNSLCLYNFNMAGNFGGIEVSGTTDGARYVAQTGREMHPVSHVNWYDAARFVNWLHNGQGNGSTEDGVYTLLGGSCTPSNGASAIDRNAGATFVLPNVDEWYKAAYHKNDGVSGNYWDYPTSSDTVPYSDQPPGSDAPSASNTANFYKRDGDDSNGYNDGYAVSGTTSTGTNPLTDVGAYTSASSPYGTFNQAGNVSEWTETDAGSSARILMGGHWQAGNAGLATSGAGVGQLGAHVTSGFRVANVTAVPEPSGFLILTMINVLIVGKRWLLRRVFFSRH